jgi:hypothetical protein
MNLIDDFVFLNCVFLAHNSHLKFQYVMCVTCVSHACFLYIITAVIQTINRVYTHAENLVPPVLLKHSTGLSPNGWSLRYLRSLCMKTVIMHNIFHWLVL